MSNKNKKNILELDNEKGVLESYSNKTFDNKFLVMSAFIIWLVLWKIWKEDNDLRADLYEVSWYWVKYSTLWTDYSKILDRYYNLIESNQDAKLSWVIQKKLIELNNQVEYSFRNISEVFHWTLDKIDPNWIKRKVDSILVWTWVSQRPEWIKRYDDSVLIDFFLSDSTSISTSIEKLNVYMDAFEKPELIDNLILGSDSYINTLEDEIKELEKKLIWVDEKYFADRNVVLPWLNLYWKENYNIQKYFHDVLNSSEKNLLRYKSELLSIKNDLSSQWPIDYAEIYNKLKVLNFNLTSETRMIKGLIENIPAK